MKRLVVNIILFLLPIALLVFLYPLSKWQMYAGLEHDCSNRANWMYDRIYQNKTPVDIAFMGSSRTINSLNEKIIAEVLPQKHLLNYGYCRYGRDLQYRLIKTLVEEKHPQYLILEVRAEENPYSHPVFPYLAQNEDLLDAYPFFNKDWLAGWSTAFRYRLQLIQESIWKPTAEQRIDSNLYGFTPNLAPGDTVELLKAKSERVLLGKRHTLKREFDNVFPLHYVKKIAQYCQRNDVNLFFLYLPSYGVSPTKPAQADFYRQYGTLLIPPTDIFENKANWADANHLNPKGSTLLSRWLANRLLSQLR